MCNHHDRRPTNFEVTMQTAIFASILWFIFHLIVWLCSERPKDQKTDDPK
ncbi:MAG: hypothetical protein ABSE73_08195 [Planctomycetota bacterium]